jgi:hypothetical protein
MGVSGQYHASAALYPPGERTPGTHWTGGWVGPRGGLDAENRFVKQQKSELVSGRGPVRISLG